MQGIGTSITLHRLLTYFLSYTGDFLKKDSVSITKVSCVAGYLTNIPETDKQNA